MPGPHALPKAIDEVWVAALIDAEHGHRLNIWRAAAGEGWRSVQVGPSTLDRVAALLHPACGDASESSTEA